MNEADEKLRDAITNAFTRRGMDARNLAVEVAAGEVLIRGSVPTEQQRQDIGSAVAAAGPAGRAPQIAVTVTAVPPSDSLDGRGRSPITGTSADSAHESRHQRDP